MRTFTGQRNKQHRIPQVSFFTEIDQVMPYPGVIGILAGHCPVPVFCIELPDMRGLYPAVWADPDAVKIIAETRYAQERIISGVDAFPTFFYL